MPTPLEQLGKQVADPAFQKAIEDMSEADVEAFAKAPEAWLSAAGFPVPDGLVLKPESDMRENFGLGKFKICVGPPFAQICYAHGPGEHT